MWFKVGNVISFYDNWMLGSLLIYGVKWKLIFLGKYISFRCGLVRLVIYIYFLIYYVIL